MINGASTEWMGRKKLNEQQEVDSQQGLNAARSEYYVNLTPQISQMMKIGKSMLSFPKPHDSLGKYACWPEGGLCRVIKAKGAKSVLSAYSR
jgi:hypothetical protein